MMARQQQRRRLLFPWILVVVVATVAFAGRAASAQGVTKPVGLGRALGLFKPDVQLPIPEKVEPVLKMVPTTVYKPQLEFHTKGFCIPRQAWKLQAAYASGCPADTYLQQGPNGKQVCAATRCAGPFGANKPDAPAAPSLGQVAKKGLATLVQKAIGGAPAQYWGGDAGTVCNTVLLKPIMTCGEGCVPDNRNEGDWCLCVDGLTPCPSPGGVAGGQDGYSWCQCDALGAPTYGLCVRDPYFCSWYCQYQTASLIKAAALKTNTCPLDPSTLDPTRPDPLFPGWAQRGSDLGA